MAALAVVANHRTAGDLGYGHGHFVPVVPRMVRRKNGKHQVFRKAAQTAHHVFHPLFFQRQLAFIGEMGNLAAAAGMVGRAFRLCAEGRGAVYGNQPSLGIGFLGRHDTGSHRLSRQGAGHKDGEIFDGTDAFSMNTQVAYGKGVDFVHFYRNISFGHRRLLIMGPCGPGFRGCAQRAQRGAAPPRVV